jgi:hypothetical protein
MLGKKPKHENRTYDTMHINKLSINTRIYLDMSIFFCVQRRHRYNTVERKYKTPDRN